MASLQETLLSANAADPFTYTSTTDDHGVGRISWNANGTKAYKWVLLKNTTATVAVAAGSLVGYGALTGYVNSLVVADMTDADAVPIAAGVATGTIAGVAGTSYYCWIQIKGRVTLDTAVTSGAAGKEFNLSTTDKTGTVAADNFSPRAGINYNTTTGAILDCPV